MPGGCFCFVVTASFQATWLIEQTVVITDNVIYMQHSCRCTLHLWTMLKNIIYNTAEFCFCTYEDEQVCLIMTLLKQTAYVLFPSQPHYPSLATYIPLSLLFMIIHSVLTKNTQENTQFKSGEILVRY